MLSKKGGVMWSRDARMHTRGRTAPHLYPTAPPLKAESQQVGACPSTETPPSRPPAAPCSRPLP